MFETFALRLATGLVIALTVLPANDVHPRFYRIQWLLALALLGAAAGITAIPSVLLCDPKNVVLYAGHPAALTEKKLQAILARPAE